MDANKKSPYLRIEHVSKKFGEFFALKDVSLDIHEGEFVCFLGPSGCGKTTLLRAIAGLDIQTSGRIYQNGVDISALPPVERDFGIVFQSYALFPNLTVGRNVAYGLENKGAHRGNIGKRVAELLDLVGLPEQIDKYPAQLSGGQQQRVALARALAIEPGLLLLDEPLSALDAKVRAHLRYEVKELQHKLGVTTIMVTHDQEEALTMADRIVVMNQGIIEQVGSPHEIYGEPASPFVADFIGTTNLISGKLTTPSNVQFGNIEIFVGDAAKHIPAGSNVVICVRPEDILADTRADKMAGAFDARVKHIEFLGASHRAYMLAVGDDTNEFAVDISALRAREMDLRENKIMKVALPADHMNVYPDEA